VQPVLDYVAGVFALVDAFMIVQDDRLSVATDEAFHNWVLDYEFHVLPLSAHDWGFASLWICSSDRMRL
jgi:hypothetical protein